MDAIPVRQLLKMIAAVRGHAPDVELVVVSDGQGNWRVVQEHDWRNLQDRIRFEENDE